MKSSNLWTFGHPCLLQALTGSAGTLNQTLQSAQRRLLNDFMPSQMEKGWAAGEDARATWPRRPRPEPPIKKYSENQLISSISGQK